MKNFFGLAPDYTCTALKALENSPLADDDPGAGGRDFSSSRRNRALGIATQPAVGAKPGPGQMDEHRAAAAGDARARVVVDFDNEIIEMIVAPEPVAGLDPAAS